MRKDSRALRDEWSTSTLEVSTGSLCLGNKIENSSDREMDQKILGRLETIDSNLLKLVLWEHGFIIVDGISRQYVSHIPGVCNSDSIARSFCSEGTELNRQLCKLPIQPAAFSNYCALVLLEYQIRHDKYKARLFVHICLTPSNITW